MADETRKIRWGIISTALIGTAKVIPAMQQARFCEIRAIASRNLDKATAAASELGIPVAYGSYQELLDDTEIEAIYNPLPNHLHVPVSIQALEAGKHVLCEKPIGLSSAEGQQLVDAARAHPELKVMEAFMFRHHPQWQKARQLVEDGQIGQLRTIQSLFTYHNVDANNIRNMADIGGGGMMDIGCYPISLSRFIFDRLPNRVMAWVARDPQFQTDILSSVMLDFGDGTSTFTCSTQLAPYQRVQIFGDSGRIEIEIPFNAPADKPCLIWHQDSNAEIQQIEFESCDQYGIQGDMMSRAILDDTPVPTPIEDAVENMLVIEAIFRSAESGQWESPTS
uniref:Predicted dehydrogenases and related proteins n=1 Tax=uncultured Rhizobium sp. HF0500_35F13 TaxID=723627 RepID=E7C634_9HYPH|nr:predicted dehydrogenases and related proteins [uncultured Rhizobium sp. HF0500_35F13]